MSDKPCASEECGRRTFLVGVSAALGASAMAGCGGDAMTMGPPGGAADTVSFAQFPKLSTTGGSVVTEVVSAGKNLLLVVVRTGAASAAVLSASCTHTGCAVAYDAAANNLKCPCHGSTYTLGGKVTGGPAPAPLRAYPAAVSATGISITLT